MMKSMKKVIVGVFSLMFLLGVAYAEEKGTAQEATSLTKKAIECFKEKGRDKAFAEFNDPKGKFCKKDLYVMVMDIQGNMHSHGANTALIGKNLYELRDSAGVYMVKEFIKTVKTKGSGWVDYKWTNPTTKKVENKSSYIERLDNDLFIVCGIYK